jgi:cystathionine beta-lyase
MSVDPFGLRSLDLERLAARPGVKWQLHPGLLAAWVADMDFPVAPAVSERLSSLLESGALGYPNWGAGPSPAARLFVDRMATRCGWEIDVDRVRDLADVLQGVRLAVGMLTDPGDAIALHLPAYHPFLHTLRDMDRRLVAAPFDSDEFAAVLARERPKALILCHPHNPTGHVFDRSELSRIAELAVEHDMVVISDEIHSDLVYEPGRHIPFASLGPDAEKRTITVTSSSKAFNLAGLRWAVMHIGHEGFDAALRTYPDHWFGAANLFGVEAAVAAWTDGDEWLQAVMAVLDENRHALSDLLAAHLPDIRYTPPEATYLAWLDCRALGSGDEPRQMFMERGVDLSPGLQFGEPGSGFVRLNFATSPEMLQRIVVAMAGS